MGRREGAHLGFPSCLLARMGVTQRFGNVSGGSEYFGALLGEEEWAQAENLQFQAAAPRNATKEELIRALYFYQLDQPLACWGGPDPSIQQFNSGYF